MPHCGLRHSCCNARAAVRRARALELLESVHRPRMRAGLEVVPPTTGPGVVTLRKAQEFAERALGPRAPLGELKAAAVVRVRVPENLLAPRERRPPHRRAAGGAAQSAQHHQRCAQKPRVVNFGLDIPKGRGLTTPPTLGCRRIGGISSPPREGSVDRGIEPPSTLHVTNTRALHRPL